MEQINVKLPGDLLEQAKQAARRDMPYVGQSLSQWTRASIALVATFGLGELNQLALKHLKPISTKED